MKNLKRLLGSFLALLLLFGSLSAGMTVLAAEKEATQDTPRSTVAFAALSVGGRAVEVDKLLNGYTLLDYGKSTAQVKWTLNEGWTVTSASYYTSSNLKDVKIDNGGTVRIPRNGYAGINISANNSIYYGYYSISIYNGRARLLNTTVWMGSGSNNTPSCEGFSDSVETVSIQSSRPGVLAVKKGGRLCDCALIPKKTGSSKVSVVVRINGRKKTFSATCTIKAYPKALAQLKVDGKAVNLNRNRFYAREKVSKDKTRLTFKPAKGWKLKTCAYYDDAANKSVKIQSGGTVKTPGREQGGRTWVMLCLTRGKDDFWYCLKLTR